MDKTFPRKFYSLLYQDKKDHPPTHDDPMIYSPKHPREQDQKNDLNIL